MTIALLTSRPIVVMASSPNDDPLGGSPAGEATMTSRPASVGALPGRSPQVAQQHQDHPRQEEVEETEEEEPDRPEDQQRGVHQVRASPTSTSRTHPPSRIRSPAPSTTSLTRVPLTSLPLVLPRSV